MPLSHSQFKPINHHIENKPQQKDCQETVAYGIHHTGFHIEVVEAQLFLLHKTGLTEYLLPLLVIPDDCHDHNLKSKPGICKQYGPPMLLIQLHVRKNESDEKEIEQKISQILHL